MRSKVAGLLGDSFFSASCVSHVACYILRKKLKNNDWVWIKDLKFDVHADWNINFQIF